MRTRNSILNFISTYGFYLLRVVFELYKVKLFLSVLGQDVHALNQLYSNVFKYLSIVEGGIGLACLYKLYKPLAEKDYDTVNVYFSTLKKTFKNIGLVILGGGVFLVFVLPYLIHDNPFTFSMLVLTFFTFIVRNVIDYFMYAPRFIITADHQQYKINILNNGMDVVEEIVQVAMLLGLKHIMASSGLASITELMWLYWLYLLPAIGIRVVQNILINRKVKKIYPWLHEVQKTDKSIKKDVEHLLVIKIVNLIHNNDDIILLSAFAGSFYVTMYGFYNYFNTFCDKSVTQAYKAMKNGIGNVTVVDSKDKVLKNMAQVRTIYSFVAVVMIVLLYFSMNPFIAIWSGKAEYVVNGITLVMILACIYSKIMINEAKMLTEVYGLFANVKWMLVISAVINWVVSIVMVLVLPAEYKIAGVLFGTVVGDFGLQLWAYSYVGYKHLTGGYRFEYVAHNFKNAFIIVAVIFVVQLLKIDTWIVPSSYVSWFLYSCVNGLICLVLIAGLFLLLFPKTFKRGVRQILNANKQIAKMGHKSAKKPTEAMIENKDKGDTDHEHN